MLPVPSMPGLFSLICNFIVLLHFVCGGFHTLQVADLCSHCYFSKKCFTWFPGLQCRQLIARPCNFHCHSVPPLLTISYQYSSVFYPVSALSRHFPFFFFYVYVTLLWQHHKYLLLYISINIMVVLYYYAEIIANKTKQMAGIQAMQKKIALRVKSPETSQCILRQSPRAFQNQSQ